MMMMMMMTMMMQKSEHLYSALHGIQTTLKRSGICTTGVRKLSGFEPHKQLVSVGYDTVKHVKYR